MIVRTMNMEEVLKQLQKDHSCVLERMNGLRIKNNKKLNNKFVGHKDILSKSTYIVKETNDTIVAYAFKYIQVVKNKEYASMKVAYYIKTCYGTYIIPHVVDYRATGYLEFSCHAIIRMRERLGKDFDDFFKEDFLKKNDLVLYPVKYDKNGDEDEYFAHMGDAALILRYENSGNKRVVKTLLSTSDLYTNQCNNKLNSKMKGEAFRAERNEYAKAEYEDNLKMFKKSGILRKPA